MPANAFHRVFNPSVSGTAFCGQNPTNHSLEFRLNLTPFRLSREQPRFFILMGRLTGCGGAGPGVKGVREGAGRQRLKPGWSYNQAWCWQVTPRSKKSVGPEIRRPGNPQTRETRCLHALIVKAKFLNPAGSAPSAAAPIFPRQQCRASQAARHRRLCCRIIALVVLDRPSASTRALPS